jgi:molecular chaperone DnaK (HSP70)
LDGKRVYGIDLGTTFSCIAYVDEASGKPSLVPNVEGDLTTPSVVLFEDGQTRVVGKEAKNTAVLEGDRVVQMVKRNMGAPGWRWHFEGTDYSPEEISSYILRKVVSDAEQHLGDRPADVVITCPAYFGIPQREATAAAGRIAGLNVLEIINEPTAAAIAYGLQDDRDQVVLVYDLGGGTFDVSVIEISGGSVSVIATGGDHELGGHDWDEQVVTYLAQEWMRETGSADDPSASPETLQELWHRAEDAKRALSARAETRVPVSHAGERVTVTLTRERFDELTQHLLENTITFTRQTLETARELGHADIDQLLLVGGSTKMPQVPARLRQELGKEPQAHEPDYAVAKGAAVYGQKLAIGLRIRTEIARELATSPESVVVEEVAPEVTARAQETVAEEMGMRLPALKKLDEMKITNVVSHSFGVVVTKRTADGERELISNLILAQQRLPAARTREYGTFEANQETVALRVMENTERSDELDDPGRGEEVGNAVLKMRSGLPEGSPVEVTFELNQEGRLTITGKDMSSPDGQTITATIETNRALSEQEAKEATARSSGITVTG